MIVEGITIILKAKSMIAGGIAAAQGALLKFRDFLRKLIMSTLGIVSLLVGAFFLVRRSVELVTTMFDRANKAARDAAKAMAAEAVDAAAERFKKLSESIKEAANQLERGRKFMDELIESTRALADAQAAYREQQEIAALPAGDAEGRKQIAERAAAQREQIGFERRIADLQKKANRAVADETRARENAIAYQKEEMALAAAQVRIVREAWKLKGKNVAEARAEMGKAAKELAEKIKTVQEKQRVALEEADAQNRERQNANIMMEAAMLERKAELRADENRAAEERQAGIDRHTEEENQRHLDHLAAERERFNKRIEALAEEEARVELDAAQKAARGKLAALEEAEEQRHRIAQMDVRQFIDEVQQKRDAEKQWQADLKKAERLRRVRGREAQDFVAAVDAIRAAREAGLPGGIAAQQLQRAREQLDALQGQQRTLDEIRRELKDQHQALRNLLAMG